MSLIFTNIDFSRFTFRFVHARGNTLTTKRKRKHQKQTDHPIIQPTYVNMSELATMAALKISNSINQHYQQQYQEQLTPPPQNPPVQFPVGTSTVSPSTTATTTNSSNADCSPDGASDTLSQQTMSPTTATHTPTNNSRSSRQTSMDGANDDMPIDSYQTLSSSTSATASMHSTNSNNIQSQSLNNGDDDDEFKHTGSVLEKLSLFERLEQRQAAAMSALNAATITNSASAAAAAPRRTDEPVKPIRSFDKDPGTFYHLAISSPFAVVFVVVIIVVIVWAHSMIYLSLCRIFSICAIWTTKLNEMMA